MANKRCSGTQTLTNWLLVNPGCVYSVTLIIDGSPITTPQNLDSGMSLAAIDAALNGNRTGNTTGTISSQYSGNNLLLTITGIVLPTSSSGAYQVTASGTGFPCPDFTFQAASLTCSIIPAAKKKRMGALATTQASSSLCFSRGYIEQIFPGSCGKGGVVYYSEKRIPYSFSHEDANGNCCFKRIQ